MRLINAYTIDPREIMKGDQMLFIVKAIVGHDGNISLYRCAWEGDEENIPQGGRLFVNEREIIESVFPALAWSMYIEKLEDE